ncbi:MAG TPA: DMT family transporter [Burkholderiales bacterium]|nr:DMT family transporter [Burkholderiales bacterium]
MEAKLSPGTGIVILLIIAVTFGANHIAARTAFDHGASVVTGVFARSLFTAAAVFVLLRLQGVRFALSRALLGRAALIGVVLAVQSYCLYSAVAQIPVALALLAFNTFPVMLALITWATGRGRPSRRVAIAMPVALVGLSIALDVWGTPIGPGVLWALAAGLAFATALFLTDLWLKAMDGRLRSALTMATIALIVAVIGGAAGAFRAPADAIGWLGLALLSVFYALAITSVFVVLPKMGSANYAVVLNFEPIALLALASIFLGQAVTPVQIIGALVTVGAIAWIGMIGK